MKKVPVDLSDCKTPEDVYVAILAALKAPRWHGHNLDAIWDSVVDGINGLEGPYRLEVSGHRNLPVEAALLLNSIQDIYAEARQKHGVASRVVLV